MIYHAFSAYTPSNGQTIRRMKLAAMTWSMQPWSEIPILEQNCRLFRDESGTVPHIKDLFKEACRRKSENDIIVFTNSDICVHSKCAYMLVGAMQSTDAVYAFRRDFGFLNTPLPDAVIPSGTDYIGCDLFAFRVGWWNAYKSIMPDMLLAREAWDCVLRLIMDWSSDGFRPSIPNLIYHERHATVWENHSNRHRLPSQIHNLRLAKEWLTFYKIPYGRFGIK